MIVKDRSCTQLSPGAECALVLEFCVYGLVEGDTVTVSMHHRHEFGYDRNGTELEYRLGVRFAISNITFDCSEALWNQACNLLQKLQQALDLLGMDVGKLFSSSLAGSLSLGCWWACVFFKIIFVLCCFVLLCVLLFYLSWFA